MVDSSRLVLGVMVFTFFLSVITSLISNTQFNLLSPITLTLVSIPLIAIITASNTPVIKGGAMVSLFIIIGGFFAFSNIPIEIYGIVIVPIFIALGLSFAEIGQG
jgi:hypothetical protein